MAEDLKEIVAHCERKEARLFAQRGYGGYIDSDELKKLRDLKAAAQKQIEQTPKANG